MTTQGQKTPFQGKKNHFLHFLRKNWSFLVLAGPKSLLRVFEWTKRVLLYVQHPQNRVGGAAGDHPGPANTVSV